jgi:hypothetical protein
MLDPCAGVENSAQRTVSLLSRRRVWCEITSLRRRGRVGATRGREQAHEAALFSPLQSRGRSGLSRGTAAREMADFAADVQQAAAGFSEMKAEAYKRKAS